MTTKRDVLEFAQELGLVCSFNKAALGKLGACEEQTYRFFHLSTLPRYSQKRWELIATLRLDDQMNIVEYNNALAICMNTLKQYQSWS